MPTSSASASTTVRSLPTRSLWLSILLAPLAAASQPVVTLPQAEWPASGYSWTPTVPLGDGRYLTRRAVLDDYLVCAAETRILRLQLRDVDQATAAALGALAERTAETDALRDALDAAEVELLACDGRRRADAADAAGLRLQLDAEAGRADALERSRDRWRTVAIVAPPVTAVGVVALIVLL